MWVLLGSSECNIWTFSFDTFIKAWKRLYLDKKWPICQQLKLVLYCLYFSDCQVHWAKISLHKLRHLLQEKMSQYFMGKQTNWDAYNSLRLRVVLFRKLVQPIELDTLWRKKRYCIFPCMYASHGNWNIEYSMTRWYFSYKRI